MIVSSATEREALHGDLGIPAGYVERRGLTIYEQAKDLVWMDGCDGPYQLEPCAARAWEEMRRQSLRDGVEIFLVSGYRSYNYQADLIRTKLSVGDDLLEVLTVVAPPGCSQHHTGRAIDLGTPGSEFLEEDFETTEAFAWLTQHAATYGFEMPFGRDNGHGFIYEPWHWYWSGTAE